MKQFLRDVTKVMQQEHVTGASPSTIQQTKNADTSQKCVHFQEDFSSSSCKKNEERMEQSTSKDTSNSTTQDHSTGSRITSTPEHTTKSDAVLRKKPLPIVAKRRQEFQMVFPSDSESQEPLLLPKPNKPRLMLSTESEEKKSDSEISHQKSCSTPDSSRLQNIFSQHNLDQCESSESSQSSVELVLENPTPASNTVETISSLIKQATGLVERTLREITYSSTNSQVVFHLTSSSNISMDIQISCQSKDPSTQQCTTTSSSHQM